MQVAALQTPRHVVLHAALHTKPSQAIDPAHPAAGMMATETVSHARCTQLPALAAATRHRFRSALVRIVLCTVAIVFSHKTPVLVTADRAGNRYE